MNYLWSFRSTDYGGARVLTRSGVLVCSRLKLSWKVFLQLSVSGSKHIWRFEVDSSNLEILNLLNKNKSSLANIKVFIENICFVVNFINISHFLLRRWGEEQNSRHYCSFCIFSEWLFFMKICISYFVFFHP